jgi:glutathione peroxidase
MTLFVRECKINSIDMKNVKTSLLLLFLFMASTAFAQKSFYDFRFKTLDGKDFDFSTLKGKKVMIVNTASKCGNTPQYKQLEALYEQYKDELVIVGFPANNFGAQEPGTNDEIRKFCTDNYNVTFPMMQKISVKGDDMDPLYKWLTSKSMNGVMDSEVKWNFQKYLIDEKGKFVSVIEPKEKPDSQKVLSWLSE